MHHERLPNGAILEVVDVTHCSSCGQRFELRKHTRSWRQCSCTRGSSGHRVLICLRGECRAQTFDPPCTSEGEEPNPLGGHERYTGWGPSADFGAG
jgi:hypothetical protein